MTRLRVEGYRRNVDAHTIQMEVEDLGVWLSANRLDHRDSIITIDHSSLKNSTIS